jgi:probable HAF family extracellular repeat protein
MVPIGIFTTRGVSGDGNVVVGNSGLGAIRWTSATGAVSIGMLPGHTSAAAYAANGDGSVVVGASTVGTTGLAFRWTAGGMASLGVVPNATFSIAYGVNGDGTVAVGSSGTTGADQRAFRWVQGVGMQDLGVFPGGTSTIAFGVSGDGERVVGTAGTPAGARAFYWDSTIGAIDLNNYLTLLGTNLTGWVLEYAAAISDDGDVIVGYGKFNGFSRGWIVRLDPDTDGDGLKDSWEISGIPYTDAGGATQRYMLPGADPMHKDLYVEVDAMAGVSLSPTAVGLVTAAFDDAPLLNPSVPSGVALHVLLDDSTLPYVAFWQTNGCWPLDFDNVRDAFFGSVAERTDPNFQGILEAKAKAYRYCVIADHAAPNRIGGCGETPGDNFVLFTGVHLNMPMRQASAFMHELGHNLGLKHGGGDSINGKPNYPSVMNYVLAYKYPWTTSFWRLDYSRFGPPLLINLNENSLNELSGIGSAGTFYSNFFMPYGVTVGPTGMTTREGPFRPARRLSHRLRLSHGDSPAGWHVHRERVPGPQLCRQRSAGRPNSQYVLRWGKTSQPLTTGRMSALPRPRRRARRRRSRPSRRTR